MLGKKPNEGVEVPVGGNTRPTHPAPQIVLPVPHPGRREVINDRVLAVAELLALNERTSEGNYLVRVCPPRGMNITVVGIREGHAFMLSLACHRRRGPTEQTRRLWR
jgi:hypothetical protein